MYAVCVHHVLKQNNSKWSGEMPKYKNNIDFSLKFVRNSGNGLVYLDYDGDSAVLELNVLEWARIAGVDENAVLDAFVGNEDIPEVGYATIDSWYSPSQYFEDPGDGGYIFKVTSIIGEQDLYDALEEYMGYMDDVLDKDTASKLLAHVHEIAVEIDKYDGYVDDSNN